MKRGGPLKRNTPLPRGKPLQANPDKVRAWQDRSRTPLPRTGITRTAPPAPGRPGDGPQRPAKARSRIAPVSAARRTEKTARAKLVGRLAAEGVVCEICPELAAAGIVVPGGCDGLGGLHERRKRSAVGSVDHAPNLLPACNAVNGWIEDRARLARERFGTWLVLREGDDEWEACARDVDPTLIEVRLCHRCGAAYVTVPPSGRLPCGHPATLF